MALTRKSPTDVELSRVLRAIRMASTSDRWHESLRTYGPAVFNDLNLLIALHTAAVELSATDPTGAQAIRRWLEELQQERSPGNIERLLLSATSDDEIRRILEANRPLITHELGMRALREVQAMSADHSAVPQTLLGAITEPILHRVELIGRFLEDDLLRAECHFMRSRVLAVLGKLDTAIAQLSEAARLFEHLGDTFRQAQCTGQIGTLQLQLNRLDLAEQSLTASMRMLDTGPENDALLAPTYEELAHIAGRNGDMPTAARYHSRAGEARLRQGQVDKAAFNFRASVPLFLQHNEDGLAFTNAEKFLSLRENGLVESASAEMDELFDELFMEAIARYVSELAANALAARDPLVGFGWRKRDAAEDQLDNANRWAALAKRGLDLTHQTETRARIHFAAAAIGLNKSDPQSAAEDAAAALPFFESSDDRKSYVGLVQTLAEAEKRRGCLEQALAVVEQALAHFDGREDPLASLVLSAQKVSALASLGRIRDAVDTLSDTLELARRGNDLSHKYYQGSLTAALGSIYQRGCQIEAAIPMQLEALRIAREIGSRSAEAMQLTTLGTECGMLDADWSENLPVRQRWELLAMIAVQGLNITLDTWQPGMPSDSLANRAVDVGTQLFRRAILAFRDEGDLESAAKAQGNLSNFTGAGDEQQLGELQDALTQLRQAGGSPDSEAVLLANMGKSYLRIGKVPEAQTCFEYSLSLSDSTGNYEWAYDTAGELATTYLLQGMWGDGEKYLRMAIDYTEVTRRDLPLEDTTRVAFARGKLEAHARLIALYLEQDRTADAFDVVQRAKSRALIDLSAIGILRPTVPMTPDLVALLEREEALLNQLRSSALDSTPAVGPTFKRSLPDIHAELDEIYTRLQSVDPRYAGMRSAQPIRFRELKQTLADQGRRILLVDYFLHPQAVFMFLLRADWEAPKCLKREIDASQLAAWREDFERQIVRYRGQGPQTWTAMAELLLEPIDDYTQDDDMIYLIPHGQLHGIPIHALPLRGTPLVESHPVIYLPTASLLPLCQSVGRGSDQLTTACAIGVEFEDEARAVAALFPRSELLLGDLTGERIAKACSDCDVIHFSSHGYYDRLDPKKSGLVIRQLTDSGAPAAHAVLTSDQIMQMRLQSEVVCLSACQSGVGRLVDGDEQLGILRAFFLAGASSVISTLWPVDVQATHEFVMKFYVHLLATFRATHRIDKPAAFRSAQRQILRRYGDFNAYYWAPFVLSGDWK